MASCFGTFGYLQQALDQNAVKSITTAIALFLLTHFSMSIYAEITE